MNRQEHMAWAKARALELCDQGKSAEALASISSDLLNHPETKDHAGLQLGIMLSLGGHLKTVPEMRKHIEGFN